MKMTLTAAFASYGAKLKNVRWASSAIADDGSLVLSCWELFLKPQPGVIRRYEDCLSRWSENRLGQNLVREHLERAVKNNLDVRLVVACVKDPGPVLAGKYDGKPTTFFVQKDLVGKVVKFNGNEFVIDFQKRQGAAKSIP